MRVLLTNNTLIWRAGSEMYVRDLAIALLRRGHQPIAYSRFLGPVADDLLAASVPVVDDLCQLTIRPDVIHAQHHVETMTAVLRWPDVPVVHVTHGWEPWEESPVRHPRIFRYVAVSELLAERLMSSGIPPQRVEVLGNAVDLIRFRSGPPLPPFPARALVFNNRANDHLYVPLVRAVCAELGISVDVIGRAAGSAVDRPEDHLAGYDLVFASGRSALEAMAVGCAVIVCDERAMGGMVTTKDLDRMRAYNFGLRLLQNPLTPDSVREEITRYDAGDAEEVSERIRDMAGLDRLVDRLESLYRQAIEEQQSQPPGPEAEAQAQVAYMQWLKPVVTDRESICQQNLDLREERDRLAWTLADATADRATLVADNEELALRARSLTAAHHRLGEQVRTVTEERNRLRDELAVIEHTTAWKARQRFLSLPAPVQRPARLCLRMARILAGRSRRPQAPG